MKKFKTLAMSVFYKGIIRVMSSYRGFVKCSFKAFTLAEVLITLGIIGVVSAMTIPTLIHKYKNDEYVAGMKKIYAILSQATLSAREEVGLEKLGATLPEKITEQIDCINNNSIPYSEMPAFHQITGWADQTTKCTLANGMYLTIDRKDINSNYSIIWGIAVVDTNGEKQPNQYGRDRWVYFITQDGRVVPSGAEIRDSDDGTLLSYDGDSIFVNQSYTNCRDHGDGFDYGCGGYLLKNNWHMDY